MRLGHILEAMHTVKRVMATAFETTMVVALFFWSTWSSADLVTMVVNSKIRSGDIDPTTVGSQ